MNVKRTVNTKQPYRIDVHHHVIPKFYREALGKLGITTTFGLSLPDWSVESHLSVMDKNKVAVGIASISTPGVYFEDAASARDLARQCNEFLASLISDYPSRFGAFAILPLPDVDYALDEAKYALDILKLDGVVMMSNVYGHYLGAPENESLFAELNRRNTVVFIHPNDPPDRGIPASIQIPIDTALETTRVAMSLLYSGMFERYPNIKFIFSHCGGITPYLAHRMVHGMAWTKEESVPDPGMPDETTDTVAVSIAIGHLQRQYYDSMTANAAIGLRTLQAFVDVSHILLGTDYAILPARYQPIKLRELMGYKGFDMAARMGVERENALHLFPRLQEVL